ncbi:hypothetical protein [Brevibacillus sp. IT-7CA2]|uniref:hypothetical protein n=1 Tax=Brevibacillus sp. IT-7CA2 TaxID=3026436 RepID=UPI0039E0F265
MSSVSEKHLRKADAFLFFVVDDLLYGLEGTDEPTKLLRRKSTGLADLDKASPVGT